MDRRLWSLLLRPRSCARITTKIIEAYTEQAVSIIRISNVLPWRIAIALNIATEPRVDLQRTLNLSPRPTLEHKRKKSVWDLIRKLSNATLVRSVNLSPLLFKKPKDSFSDRSQPSTPQTQTFEEPKVRRIYPSKRVII